ncbi:hypothetical protein HY989_03770 [Candidatus Micrarchaeota archaeon]|nr:hypothetical protein [Candidatus Micrarchaeota archaeon]
MRKELALAYVLLIAFATSADAFFYLNDAFPSQGTSGNLTVELCSYSNQAQSVNDSTNFTFWLNDQLVIYNSANFSQCASGTFGNNATDTLYQMPSMNCTINPPLLGGGPNIDRCAKFGLNTTWSNAKVTLNVTAHLNPALMQQYTLNYLNIRTNTANTLFMLFNETSARFASQGPALTDAFGHYMEHCLGPLSGTLCLNACRVHGIPFPNVQSGPGYVCTDSTQKILFFDFISSNSTNATVNFDNSAFVFYNLTSPISIIQTQMFPFFGQPGEQPSFPSQNGTQILNETNGLLFDLPSQGGGMGGGSPGFVAPFKRYYIRFTGNLNTSGNMTYFDNQYPFIPTNIGMTGAIIVYKAATEYTTFIGKVINQSGSLVTTGIVYAQPLFGFSPPMGIGLVNSSFTDPNGIFRIRVPKNVPYKFLIAANDTNPLTGSLIYNPTINTNNGRGYFAQQDTVILPQLTIQSGGTVNLNVILRNATGVLSEVARLLSLPAGATRDAFSSRMSPINIFSNVAIPTSMFIPLVAPINTVYLTIYGVNISGAQNEPPQVTHICMNSTAVAQGQVSQVTCTLNSTPGGLNITVEECMDSIFTCAQRNNAFNIWFDSRIVLSNANGLVASFEEGTMAQENAFRNPGQILLKIPAGNYNFSIIPKFPFRSPLGIHYKGTATIVAGQVNSITVRRQTPGWQINPSMNFQMRTTQNNKVETAVYDFGQNPPAILDNTKINVNIQALQLNGSYAGNMSNGISMVYYSNIKIPGPIVAAGGFNASFRPADFNIAAGKYMMLFNATSDLVANQTTFGTTTFPFTVSDFDLGLELAKFSFATTESIKGKIYAYLANGTAVSGTATISFYDMSGVQVGSSQSATVTSGEGAFSVLVSDITSQVGFYEMSVVLNAGSQSGYANNFLQVTNFIISTDFDKQNYKPNEQVLLTVKVLNSTGGAVANASIEGLVDSNQNATFGQTDASGLGTLAFNPIAVAGGNWSFGFHAVRLKIASSTATQVIQQEVFAGFNVKGFDVQISTDKPNYLPEDNVTLNIFFNGQPQQPSLLVDNLQYTPMQQDKQQTPFGFRVVISPQVLFGAPSATWTPGRHQIEFSFSSGTNSQSVFASFDVNVVSVVTTPDKFSYQIGENATILIKVTNMTNGNGSAGVAVNGTLFKFQQSGDLQLRNASNVTNGLGIAYLSFNLTKSGFHYVKTTVLGQTAFTGFLVSGMNLALALNRDSYSPGDTMTATINVTGANASNASVSAKLFAYGSSSEISTNNIAFIGNGLNGPYIGTFTYAIPSNAPSITYFLDVKITLANGDTGFAAIPVVISGGQKLTVIADRAPSQPYKVGDGAVFTATLVSAGNNTPVNGSNVSFEIGSATGSATLVGSALTDASGKAALSVSPVNMPTSDGNYYLRAYLTSSTTTQSYTGFSVSSLIVSLGVGSTNSFTLGQNITFSVNVSNATTLAALTPTSGSIIIWDKNRGSITLPMTISGGQPYTLTTTIPDTPQAVGSYTVIAYMQMNSSFGADSILLQVQNSSALMNVTLPSIMNASIAFPVNISIAGVLTPLIASLRVFSPSAANVTYTNTSINLTGGSVNVSVNITIPGKYVFVAEITNYGTAKAIGEIFGSANSYSYKVWTTNDTTGTNSTTFTASQTAYIWSNAQNSTAVVMYQNTTTNFTSSSTLPVIAQVGGTGNYYTTFSNTVSGYTYFVRLDTQTSAGVAGTVFKVS